MANQRVDEKHSSDTHDQEKISTCFLSQSTHSAGNRSDKHQVPGNKQELTGLGREARARISGRSRSYTRWLRYTDPGGAGARARGRGALTTTRPPPVPRPVTPAPRKSTSIAAVYARARSSTAARRRRAASTRSGRRAIPFAPSPPRIDADATAIAGGITESAPAGSCDARGCDGGEHARELFF